LEIQRIVNVLAYTEQTSNTLQHLWCSSHSHSKSSWRRL